MVSVWGGVAVKPANPPIPLATTTITRNGITGYKKKGLVGQRKPAPTLAPPLTPTEPIPPRIPGIDKFILSSIIPFLFAIPLQSTFNLWDPFFLAVVGAGGNLKIRPGDICWFKSNKLWHGNFPMKPGALRFSVVYFSNLVTVKRFVECTKSWDILFGEDGFAVDPESRRTESKQRTTGTRKRTYINLEEDVDEEEDVEQEDYIDEEKDDAAPPIKHQKIETSEQQKVLRRERSARRDWLREEKSQSDGEPYGEAKKALRS
ncbi:hypothetical protein HK097_011567 [Rhizophlyctis rosea]|uniref:Uncharacterized protein n=1 Tax=Rhizophlyctis rosea TaxID=64517 RepID=A0AAD5X761_9FUNG|nr:hypothetical protein HK097_011567 [Rhizophlyctis rosea]